MKAPKKWLIALTLLPVSAFATTWGEDIVKDPITGKDCAVQSPMSSGSYIYQWPSKYDGVYWPFTDPNWIWFCKDSGYTSFGNDFDALTADEVKAVAAFLDQFYVASEGEVNADYKLWLLESTYRLRNTEPGFWGWFKRVKANIYEEMASSSRYEAVALLEKEVAQLEPGFDLVQKLYVLGDYYRRFGDPEKAKAMFVKSAAVEWLDKKGTAQRGSPYINEIIEERLKLMEERQQ